MRGWVDSFGRYGIVTHINNNYELVPEYKYWIRSVQLKYVCILSSFNTLQYFSAESKEIFDYRL